MPDIERYTPAQLEEEVQSLAEGYVSAVNELETDTEIFEDISEAIQSKTGQQEAYEKDELAGAIDGIVVDPNANLDAYIQGDLTDIVTSSTIISSGTFARVPLNSIVMPNVTIIYDWSFSNIQITETILMPKNLQSIRYAAFYQSSATWDMSEVDNIPTIDSTAFLSSSGKFLFRDQTQLDAYAGATNWSALADRFQIKGE